MNTAITALFEMIKQLLCVKQTEMEHKESLDIVKDKKSLKKATNYTEQLLVITDKYIEYFNKSDLRKYKSLKKKFLKNN